MEQRNGFKTNKHTVLAFFCSFTFLILFTYLGFSFVFIDLNPEVWSKKSREAFLVLCFFEMAFSALIANAITVDEKNNNNQHGNY